MDAERRDRLSALLATQADNPLTAVVRELLAELDSHRHAAEVVAERDGLRERLRATTDSLGAVTTRLAHVTAERDGLRPAATQAAAERDGALTRLRAAEAQRDALRTAVDPLRVSVDRHADELLEARQQAAEAVEARYAMKAERDAMAVRLAEHEPPRHLRAKGDR